MLALRDRHDIIKQTILRNDHFSPSTLPGKERDRLLNASSCDLVSDGILNMLGHTAKNNKAASRPRW